MKTAIQNEKLKGNNPVVTRASLLNQNCVYIELFSTMKQLVKIV